jgi:hypothetical protein
MINGTWYLKYSPALTKELSTLFGKDDLKAYWAYWSYLCERIDLDEISQKLSNRDVDFIDDPSVSPILAPVICIEFSNGARTFIEGNEEVWIYGHDCNNPVKYV